MSTTAPQGADEQAERVDRLAQIVACRGQEGGLGQARLFGDVLLALQIRGQLFGSNPQADDLPERSVRGDPDRAHPADVDQHQPEAGVPHRIGGRQGLDHEGDRRRQKDAEEGRQVGAEGRDRAGGHGEHHQHDDQLDIEPAPRGQIEGRPAPADALGEGDHREPETPGPPAFTVLPPPPVGEAEQDMAGGAGVDVEGPGHARPQIDVADAAQDRGQDDGCNGRRADA